jgi:type VI secretion system secreted protein VgrG
MQRLIGGEQQVVPFATLSPGSADNYCQSVETAGTESMTNNVYTQANRPLAVATPLTPDALLLVGFSGHEGISQLFRFHLDLIARNKQNIPFDQLLGQKLAVRLELPGGKQRYFGGICSRFSQGESDDTFTSYSLEMVPQLWLWTKRVRSRIFQHKNIPDILREVLTGLDVVYQLQGTFHPRDYCVQYRESDFAFASRLMEEEGIFYFFKHSDKGHQLVVANTPQSHPDVPGEATITYKSIRQVPGEATATYKSNGQVARDQNYIYDWNRSQQLTSGKVTLRDHHFELPGQNLQAAMPILESVAVGTVTHKLKVDANDQLEVYDYPGGYAQRFDGIDKGGGERPAALQKIFEDNKRTTTLRMQQTAAEALVIQGAGNCRHLVSGHKFTLATAPYDVKASRLKADGDYVLTGVTHEARFGGDFRSGDWKDFEYANRFTCLPLELPFRPQQVTPKPVVPGSQTAIVVGPAGEEIFTDKYGRVKVQFPWDRHGKFDADSSCWVRVATPWAGKGWGVIHIPRIGHEVVVDFLEGDPDQPIIIGSVYNADHMPPGKLPKDKMVSGLRSNTTPRGGGHNGMVFDDTKGKEKITVHGQHNMHTTVENDQTTTVHNNRTTTVDVNDTESVGSDQKVSVGSNQKVSVGANQETTVGANQNVTVGANQSVSVGAAQTLVVGAAQKVTVNAARTTNVAAADDLTVGGAQTLNITGPVSITSGAQITLAVGGSSIVIGPGGIRITSSGVVEVTGAMVKINC